MKPTTTVTTVEVKESKILFNDGEDWLEEAGEIPEHTCPDIDKTKKEINSVVDNVKYLIKQVSLAYDLEEARSIVDDVCGDITSDLWGIPEVLEELRNDNLQLRELGRFWYEKCKILQTKLSGEVQND